MTPSRKTMWLALEALAAVVYDEIPETWTLTDATFGPLEGVSSEQREALAEIEGRLPRRPGITDEEVLETAAGIVARRGELFRRLT